MRHPTTALAALLLALLTTAPARAQAPTPSPADPTHTRLAADVLARSTVINLRNAPEPIRTDYAIAARSLQLVSRMVTDPELLRLEIKAWRAAADNDTALERTADLVRLDPDDDVALLRILIARLRKHQTVDERLAAYDRILGAAGQNLHPSLRSRVALDAALIARENGDENVYFDRLLLATQLDVTNKDAAALYATEFLPRTDDPLERFDILANVVLADPVEPAAHRNLAHELLDNGAYRGAKRFFERYGDLLAADGQGLPSTNLFEYYLALWEAEGRDAVIDPLNIALESQRLAQQAERQSLIEIGLDPGPEEEPVLTVNMESLRLAHHWLSGNIAGIAESIRLIKVAHNRAIEQLRNPPEDAEPASEQEINRLALEALLQGAMFRLWAAPTLRQADQRVQQAEARLADPDLSEDQRAQAATQLEQARAAARAAQRQLDAIPQDLDAIRDARDQDLIEPAAVQRFDAFAKLAQGQPQDAIDALKPLADRGDRLARFALALAYEQADRIDDAVQTYARVAVNNPATVTGVASRSRIEQLLDRAVRPPEAARRLDQTALDFAPWLDRFTASPRAFMELRIQHAANSIPPTGRIVLRVELRNISEQPLALGPDDTIPSRILIGPALRQGGRDLLDIILDERLPQEIRDSFASLTAPEIIELDRRLRLDPGQAITTDVFAGVAGIGRLVDFFPGQGFTIRWRALQGVRAGRDPEGAQFERGPMALTAQSDILRKTPNALPPTTEQLVQNINEATLEQIPDTILAAGAVIRRAISDAQQSPQQRADAIDDIANALHARADELTPALRAYAVSQLALIPQLGRGGAFRAESGRRLLEALIQDNATPPIHAALLNVAVPGDPLLQRAQNTGDEQLAQLARDISQRFELAARAQEAARNRGQQNP